jgi:hypothetical protein
MNGTAYADLTARNAALAVQRRPPSFNSTLARHGTKKAGASRSRPATSSNAARKSLSANCWDPSTPPRIWCGEVDKTADQVRPLCRGAARQRYLPGPMSRFRACQQNPRRAMSDAENHCLDRQPWQYLAGAYREAKTANAPSLGRGREDYRPRLRMSTPQQAIDGSESHDRPLATRSIRRSWQMM